MRRGRMWQLTSSSFSSLNPRVGSQFTSPQFHSRTSLSSGVVFLQLLQPREAWGIFRGVLTITDGTARTSRVADTRAREVASPPQHCLLELFSVFLHSLRSACVFQRVATREISLILLLPRFRPRFTPRTRQNSRECHNNRVLTWIVILIFYSWLFIKSTN